MFSLHNASCVSCRELETEHDPISQSVPDSITKKQFSVTLRPTYWDNSHVETHLVVAEEKEINLSDDDDDIFLEPASSGGTSESKSSGTFFPSFTLPVVDHCRKLVNIDLFRTFPRRPYTIPVSMAESPCVQLPTTINVDEFYSSKAESSKCVGDPASLATSTPDVTLTTADLEAKHETSEVPGGKPSTSKGERSHHGWFRNAWEASISCISPIVAKWPMLAKQQTNGGG